MIDYLVTLLGARELSLWLRLGLTSSGSANQARCRTLVRAVGISLRSTARANERLTRRAYIGRGTFTAIGRDRLRRLTSWTVQLEVRQGRYVRRQRVLAEHARHATARLKLSLSLLIEVARLVVFAIVSSRHVAGTRVRYRTSWACLTRANGLESTLRCATAYCLESCCLIVGSLAALLRGTTRRLLGLCSVRESLVAIRRRLHSGRHSLETCHVKHLTLVSGWRLSADLWTARGAILPQLHVLAAGTSRRLSRLLILAEIHNLVAARPRLSRRRQARDAPQITLTLLTALLAATLIVASAAAVSLHHLSV